MSFLVSNRKKINIAISVSYGVDVIIGIISNLVSQTPFAWNSKKNMIFLTILIILVIIQILCNIYINAYNSQVVPRKLRKAFSEIGGYDVAALEMQHCIQTGNVKKFKDIRKMVSMIEK